MAHEEIEENMKKINFLLQDKNVSVIDDLIQDIFIDDESNRTIFISQKLDERSPIDVQLAITNNIISELKKL